MADEDWYRADTWGPPEQQAFEARLAAARRENRQQYLAIQAMTLLSQPDEGTQQAGVALADRALSEGDQRFEIDRIHDAMALYYEQKGHFHDALAQLRLVTSSTGPDLIEEGESLRIATIIAREQFQEMYDEAEDRLDLVLAADRWIMRAVRADYAVARARLAGARGRPNEAAAFALGALLQITEDQRAPLVPRHPDVGRVTPDGGIEGELLDLVNRGNAESADSVVDDYRDVRTGEVQWRWPLILRLRTSPYDIRRNAEDATRETAAPMLAELRAAGADTYSLDDVSSRILSVAQVPEILVSWLQKTDDRSMQFQIAMALADRRARRVATQPLIDLFREKTLAPLAKDRVAAAMGTLARDESFEQLAELVRDVRHGEYRAYLFLAISYSKRPEAVDLCLELLDDPELPLSALRSLGDLRSRRAEATLRAVAGEPMPSGHDDEAQLRRDRVRLARKGLAKLERAMESGKARP